MKINRFITMMVATVALVLGMSSCGSDDDEPEVAVAAQVEGSYTGQETLTVDGEPDEGSATFVFAKSSDTSVDMTIPEYGMGMMTLPPLTVKNIPLSKNDNTITGKLVKYEGVVTSANGSEKAYVVSDVTVMFSDKTVVVTSH